MDACRLWNSLVGLECLELQGSGKKIDWRYLKWLQRLWLLESTFSGKWHYDNREFCVCSFGKSVCTLWVLPSKDSVGGCCLVGRILDCKQVSVAPGAPLRKTSNNNCKSIRIHSIPISTLAAEAAPKTSMCYQWNSMARCWLSCSKCHNHLQRARGCVARYRTSTGAWSYARDVCKHRNIPIFLLALGPGVKIAQQKKEQKTTRNKLTSLALAQASQGDM